MDNIKSTPIVGVLGGVGSGKSAVAAEFAKLGCKVIDADKIAHELLDQPDVRQKIVGFFGESALDSAGKIDRRKLADIVFGDAEKLSALNKIIHPLVLKRVEELIGLYKQNPRIKAIVLDMPLLAEVGWANRCDKLIFVDCQRPIRVDRVKKMGIFDEDQLKIRENFQISLDKKAKLADNIIDNNSDFSALVRQVANIFSHVVDNE